MEMELSELLNTDTVKLTVVPAILVLVVLFFWFKRGSKKRSKNRTFGRAPNSRHDNLDWSTAVSEADQEVRLGQAYDLDVLGDEELSVGASQGKQHKDNFDHTISNFDDEVSSAAGMSASRDEIDFLDEVEQIYSQPEAKNKKRAEPPRTDGAEDIIYNYDDDLMRTGEASTSSLVTAEEEIAEVPAEQVAVEQNTAPSSNAEGKQPEGEPLLLVLNVVATEGRQFRGGAVLKSLTATGLTFGDMNVFHYYHPQRPGKAMFSIANMIEPGSFTLATMEELNTPGLIMFANVERPEDGINTFTIMVETAKKLAELLGGTVCDQHRGTLSKQGIEHIHGEIREHQRRSRLVHAARA